MNRFYLVDKPLWISSFDVIRKLRKILNVRKMGHTGTLDPLASWCMLIATGSYTKLIPYLEKSRKTYHYTVELNGSTSSWDAAEEIHYISQQDQQHARENIKQEHIETLIQEKFLWKVSQVPPQFSALKIDGKRAYELAREWKEVIMKKRDLEIFSHIIHKYNYPTLELEVEVSAGAYVRSLAVDIWKALWLAWYVSELRRTKIAQLEISSATPLGEVTQDNYFAIDTLFDPKYYLTTLSEYDQKRLTEWLPRIGTFDLEMDTPYFVYNGESITNVVQYDWTQLKPIKNIH